MNEMTGPDKRRFMVRQWEDLKKSGGVTFPIETINEILQRGGTEMLTREELINKVVGYFNSCVKVVIDEDTGERVTTWIRNPTKTDLALILGIDKQTLIDYVKGTNSAGSSFSCDRPDYKRVVATADFDILRKAYSLIESFYEGKLADNRNNAGVIYWLNNANNTRWSNEQEFKFSTNSNINSSIGKQTPDQIAKQYGYVLETDGDYDSDSDIDLPPI